MRPVAQLIDSAENGDCFRACVASILEVDLLRTSLLCLTHARRWGAPDEG